MQCGTKVGSFGDAEVFSLSGTKVVTSAEGGLVTSRDSELLDRITLLRGYGFYGDYNTKMVGMNAKMSELHAALGILTVGRVEDAIAARRRHVMRYQQRLGMIPGLTFQRVRSADRSTHKDFAVLFGSGDARRDVEEALTREGIQTKRYFLPCHRMDAFKQYATSAREATDAVYERVLCLPLYESLMPEQVDAICDVVTEAVSCSIGA
jgi:dTDP-4-amino-4,6-dideoxygalactose transaminase